MLYHHFFAFPEWLIQEINYIDFPHVNSIAVFGKICVAVFTVLSGYGMYAGYKNGRLAIEYKDIAKRIFCVLLNWWLVLTLVQLPIEYLMGDRMNWKVFWGYFTLMKLPNNPFVEYLKFYVCFLLSFPVIVRLIRKSKHDWIICMAMPIVGIFIRKILFINAEAFSIGYIYVLYIPYAVIGCYLCKHKIIDKIGNKLFADSQLKKWVIGIGMILAVVCIRKVLGASSLSFDSWLAAVFVIACAGLVQNKGQLNIGGRIFAWLGGYSTNLWYIHAILIFSSGGKLQQLLYMPKIPILITAWGVILCLPAAMLIHYLMVCYKKRF